MGIWGLLVLGLLLGAALMLASALNRFSETAASAVIVLGVLAGLGFILYGQFKYNGGLF